uniref:MGAT4 conserved region domain-containing protein n=1 Tax=Magallana gigas TaxID=29159 RepID=A0A8W8NJ11_MAGGI
MAVKLRRRALIQENLVIIIFLAVVHCFVIWLIVEYTQYGNTIAWIKGNNIGGSPQKIVLELKVANGVNLSHQRVGYLTIALPAVRRLNGSTRLVEDTLNSLIVSTLTKDVPKILIVVFLLTDDPVWTEKTGNQLYDKYKEHVDKGFVQIVRGHRNGLSKLFPFPASENSEERQRRAENLHYLNIMAYAKNLSSYLLLLDEDVRCQSNYIQKIFGFIQANTKPNRVWFVLNFSHSNLMGQLTKTSNLLKAIKLLIVLRYDVTYETLIDYIRALKGQPKKCQIKYPPFRYANMKRKTFLHKNFTQS